MEKKNFTMITFGEMPSLVHTSDNVAVQIFDTAQFLREHMQPTSVLTIMDPTNNERIAIGCFADEMANDFERLLCEICANEDTYIHAVLHNLHTNHLIVVIPFNKHVYKYNAIYSYANQQMEYLTTIN